MYNAKFWFLYVGKIPDHRGFSWHIYRLVHFRNNNNNNNISSGGPGQETPLTGVVFREVLKLQTNNWLHVVASRTERTVVPLCNAITEQLILQGYFYFFYRILFHVIITWVFLKLKWLLHEIKVQSARYTYLVELFDQLAKMFLSVVFLHFSFEVMKAPVPNGKFSI